MKRDIKKGLDFLGIDEKEHRIIEALKAGGSLRPIDIARKTGVGRTTVNFLLKKLQLRGVLVRSKIKNHYEWTIADNVQIKSKIENLYKSFNISPLEGFIHLPEDIGIEIFKGKKRVLEAYENILKIGSNKRIFFIQGNKSVIAALKDLPRTYINYLQEGYRKHKIILDGIVGESTLNYIETLKSEDLKIYENRMVVVYIISDQFIDFDMDILIFEKMVTLINYKKSLVIIIKNEEICKAILSIMETMKAISRKIDFNKFIRELIESKK